MKFLKRFLEDESGPTAVEYAVMLALIFLAAFASIQSLGTIHQQVWTNVSTSVTTAGT